VAIEGDGDGDTLGVIGVALSELEQVAMAEVDAIEHAEGDADGPIAGGDGAGALNDVHGTGTTESDPGQPSVLSSMISWGAASRCPAELTRV